MVPCFFTRFQPRKLSRSKCRLGFAQPLSLSLSKVKYMHQKVSVFLIIFSLSAYFAFFSRLSLNRRNPDHVWCWFLYAKTVKDVFLMLHSPILDSIEIGFAWPMFFWPWGYGCIYMIWFKTIINDFIRNELVIVTHGGNTFLYFAA